MLNKYIHMVLSFGRPTCSRCCIQ